MRMWSGDAGLFVADRIARRASGKPARGTPSVSSLHGHDRDAN
jgi:hypothetical protein